MDGFAQGLDAPAVNHVLRAVVPANRLASTAATRQGVPQLGIRSGASESVLEAVAERVKHPIGASHSNRLAQVLAEPFRPRCECTSLIRGDRGE